MAFQVIDEKSWPRAQHFQYYSQCLKTNYQITVQMDITNLHGMVKERKLRFFPVFLYAVMRGVNQNKEFRMAYHQEKLGYWDVCHPSYTIFHEDDKTFSDIWSEYDPSFPEFYRRVAEDMEHYRDVKGVKTKPNRPENACPVSGIPWISYTALSHDTTGPTRHYFPVINFGRFTEEDSKVILPFSVYVNHAAADGYHTSKLIQDIQAICAACGDWIETL